MTVRLIFSGRDRNVLHALPAVLWLASCLYTVLILLGGLPPVLAPDSPTSLKNVAVVAMCFLLMYPVYRLGYMTVMRLMPEASVTKRIAAMSLACVALGALALAGALMTIDPASPRHGSFDTRWYAFNLIVGIILMPVFFFLIRGGDIVREQITGARTGAVKLLLRKAGPDAGQRLVRLQSADHYVEVHTEAGPKLLLMRLGDAVEMLSGADGGQVHRSHWVNFDEVSGVVKRDRKIWLKMSDGAEVPVSRPYRPPLREAGLI